MSFPPSPGYPACDICKAMIPPTNDHIHCSYCGVALCYGCQHLHGPGHRNALVVNRGQPFMAAPSPLSPPPRPNSAAPVPSGGWQALPPTPQPSPHGASYGAPLGRHASVPFAHQPQHPGQGYLNPQSGILPWHQPHQHPLPSPPQQPTYASPPPPQYGRQPQPQQQQQQLPPPNFQFSPPNGRPVRPGAQPQQRPQGPLRPAKSQSSFSKVLGPKTKKFLKGGLLIGGAALLGADLSDAFDGGDVDTSATDGSFGDDADYGSSGDLGGAVDPGSYGSDYSQDMSYTGDSSGGFSGDGNYAPNGDTGTPFDSQGDYGSGYQQATGCGGDAYGDAGQQSGGYGDAAAQAVDTQTQQDMAMQNASTSWASLQACATMPVGC